MTCAAATGWDHALRVLLWYGAPVPSFLHEVLVDLFRQAPSLARELLLRSAGVELPGGADEIGSVDLSEVTSPAYTADALVVVREKDGKAIAVVVVEVQLQVDGEKLLSWPAYLASARREYVCPAFLLVVTPDEKVARWAREPIELGHPGFRLEPLVVGPSSVPVPEDVEAARRLPELAVLAALARPGEEVARTAIAAVHDLLGEGGLAAGRADLYLDLVLSVLPDAVRRAVEAWMPKYEYQSEFARRYVAEGKAEGKAEGVREALLRVLQRRGFTLSPDFQRKVEAEPSVERLERWLDLAVTAQSLADVFADA